MDYRELIYKYLYKWHHMTVAPHVIAVKDTAKLLQEF